MASLDCLSSKSGANFQPWNVPPGTEKTVENHNAKECPHFGQMLLLAELLGIPGDELCKTRQFCGVLASWGEDGMMFSGDKTEVICACLPMLRELHNQYHWAKKAHDNAPTTLNLCVRAEEEQIHEIEKVLKEFSQLVKGQKHLERLCASLKPQLTPESTLRRMKSILDSVGLNIMGVEISEMEPSAVVIAVEGFLHGWGNLPRDKACEQMPSTH